MRINYISPVSFGHSKQSRKYLDKKIEQCDKKEHKEALLTCSHLCDEMEEKVKQYEKNPDEADSYYEELFVNLKDNLYSHVFGMYEDYKKYFDSEYKYYSHSLEMCKNQGESNWRTKLLKNLRMWDNNTGKTDEEIREELEKTKKEAELSRKSVADVLKTYKNGVEEASTSTESSPVIEKLQKTDNSPNGLKDVMGMNELKRDLKKNIIEPANNPSQAKKDLEDYGKKMPSGVLLYGPPGCGKTFIIQALAYDIDSSVYVVNSANTGSKFVNQTANNIRKVFEAAYKEGDNSEKPIFLFMDEMDAMTKDRGNHISPEDDKSVAVLLQYIENAKNHNVIVVGATNKYDLIDPAIRRRFDMKKYVGTPNQEQREELIRNNLSKKKKAKKLLEDKDAINQISKALEGYSYHSINIICDSASLNALDRKRADISLQDFYKAIKETDEEKIKEKEYKTETKKMPMGFNNDAFAVRS